MRKLFALLATIMIALSAASAEDYTAWGYYWGDMSNPNLSMAGAGTAELRVAILVPGDGILAGNAIAGINVPVVDASAVTALRAWVTPTLTSDETYAQQVEITDYANGYNQAIFPESYTVPEAGCYVGYTITVNTSLNTDGSKYPACFDPETKADNSLWIWFSAQNGWEDYGNQFGASCLQVLFSNITLPETAAYFGTIKNGFTAINTETDFPVTVYSNAAEAISSIEYTIDVNGIKETRTADVAVESGLNKSSEITVKVASPAEVGSYNVVLAITKVNGKDNTLADNSSESTFNNLTRLVVRNTLVEELTGTGCPWCPRGLQGLANLRAEFGDRFIGLAIHQYNTSDPMYPNYYISSSKLGLTSAPSCTLDRKEVMDPYYGTEQNERYILQDFEDYCSIPADVDLSMKSEWVGENKDSVKIDVNIESLGEGTYNLVYVLVADSLIGTATAWRQANNYNMYTASQVGDEDLAKFAKGGEYGQSRFFWAFDDVVIASSYTAMGANKSSAVGKLSAGASAENSYTLALPTKAALRAAVDASIDKVYAVAFAVNADGTVAQAVKAPVGQPYVPAAIEDVAQDKVNDDEVIYDLQGRQISAPHQGQLFIRNGKKMIIR